MPRRLLLDGRQAFWNVAERDGQVADIGELQSPRIDPMNGMIAIEQHAAGLADRRRAEPRPAPNGDADIERNSRDADGGLRVGRQAEKVGGTAKVGGSLITRPTTA